jgi:hypothetical protein
MTENLSIDIADLSSTFGAASPVNATVPYKGNVATPNGAVTEPISEEIDMDDGLPTAGKRTTVPDVIGFSKVNIVELVLLGTPAKGADIVFVPADMTSPFFQYITFESIFGRLTVSSCTSVRYGSSSLLQATPATKSNETNNKDFFTIQGYFPK